MRNFTPKRIGNCYIHKSEINCKYPMIRMLSQVGPSLVKSITIYHKDINWIGNRSHDNEIGVSDVKAITKNELVNIFGDIYDENYINDIIWFDNVKDALDLDIRKKKICKRVGDKFCHKNKDIYMLCRTDWNFLCIIKIESSNGVRIGNRYTQPFPIDFIDDDYILLSDIERKLPNDIEWIE